MQLNPPVIIFGAFDRHNLGDLLFPHIIARLLGKKRSIYAGLFSRDMRPFGGHTVRAIAEIAKSWGERSAHVIHAGGELLTCDAWEAAVMTLSMDKAREIIARYGSDVSSRLAWAAQAIGFSDRAPYILHKRLFKNPGIVIYSGVGGVELDRRDSGYREEAAGKLRAADFLSVRDDVTKTILEGAGVRCGLAPDSVVLVKDLFKDRIIRRARRGEPARVSGEFPGGYMAVQFSENFSSGHTLHAIADQIGKAAADLGLGLVFFRAGTAPWHDDIAAYARCAALLPALKIHLFESLHIWDICALLAGCRVFCGASLHARIVADAFDIPAVNFVTDTADMSKQRAYGETWNRAGTGQAAGISGIAAAIHAAVKAPAIERKRISQDLAQQCRRRFEKVKSLLEQ